jgi:hypothetical protein
LLKQGLRVRLFLKRFLPPGAKPVQLVIKPGILRMKGAERLPFIVRFGELSLRFVVPGAGDQRIHQIALLFDGPQPLRERRFVRKEPDRFLGKLKLLLEICFRLDPRVELGDCRRTRLPLALIDRQL